MKSAIIYIHGKGGSHTEAEYYRKFFDSDYEVMGFDYKSESPWEAKVEFIEYFDSTVCNYDEVILIANSIGAYYAMLSLADKPITKAIFISPIVDMEKLILNMMRGENVSEEELKVKKVINTSFGEPLSWEYLSYVRDNSINWKIPTDILYGENDNLTSFETMKNFANKINATLTVMKNGEHWFHTEEQMKFLENRIRK